MVLFATFIGGTAYFFGPILGAILVTYLQLGLTNVTTVWQLYFGIIFIGIVMFAPGGIAGLMMMHRPLIRAGTLMTVIPSYLIAIDTRPWCWRSVLSSRSRRSRATPKASGNDDQPVRHVPFNATAPTTWLPAARSCCYWRIPRPLTWRRIAEAWDRATTAARDRGYLA